MKTYYKDKLFYQLIQSHIFEKIELYEKKKKKTLLKQIGK